MSDVLKVHQLAEKLGMTEAAVRQHMYRRTNAIPPWFYQGTRVRWRKQTVEKWLEEQEEEAMRERVVRPTRRRSGGSTASTD